MIQPKFDIGDDVLIRGTVKKITISEGNSVTYLVSVEENGGFDCLLCLTSDEIVDIPKNPVIWGGSETC